MDNTASEEELKDLQLQAVLAEYNDLRDEIKRRIDQRTHISYFVIAIILCIFGLYVKSNNPMILVFTPLALIYWLFIVDSSYSVHLNIIGYIRDKIEGIKLPMLIGKVDAKEGWINWETYYFEDKKKRCSGIFKVFVIFSWLIYIICGIIITCDMIITKPSITLFLLYWIVYGIFMIYFSYKCWRYYHYYGSKDK